MDRFGARTKFSLSYVLFALLAVVLFQELMSAREERVPYSRFRADLAAGRIAEVTIEEQRLLYTVAAKTSESESGNVAEPSGGTSFTVVRVEDDTLVSDLVAAGVRFEAKAARGGAQASRLSRER